jgi:prevent-host-death family protein
VLLVAHRYCGVKELRQNASVLLRRVAAGESILVTDRGRSVARLSPVARSRIAELRAAGLVREPLRKMKDAPPPVQLGKGQPTAAEALATARADER